MIDFILLMLIIIGLAFGITIGCMLLQKIADKFNMDL